MAIAVVMVIVAGGCNKGDSGGDRGWWKRWWKVKATVVVVVVVALIEGVKYIVEVGIVGMTA